MKPRIKPLHVTLIFAITLHLLGGLAIAEQWPGEPADWNGHAKHSFQVDGRNAYVVLPREAAPGNPWVWRARFPDFHTEADMILLDRGFHIGFIDTNGMLGSPRAMQHWDAFYAFMTEHGLAKRVALEGVSRGGLFVYGYAARHPERVACIYADTPVCDIKSWPGGKGEGVGHEATWQVLLKEYGFTEEEALAYKGNPIDNLEPIAKAEIPLLTIVSLNDKVVPPAENTFILAERYRKLGGRIDIIEVPEGTAQSNGHHFTHPDPLRIAHFIERHAASTPDPHDYFTLRNVLNNSRIRFASGEKARVAFLGGSITYNPGWRDQTAAFLKEKFPNTAFEFIAAGIPSMGSTPHAFRLERDILSHGRIDLLFVEAAVNDSTNGRTREEMIRGMEGIVHHVRREQPECDIIMMHFVAPWMMDDYRAGRTPEVIEQHDTVAKHYGVTTINLAREVTERIDSGQFTWKDDFRDLHPSPFGQRLYSATIRRMLNTAWEEAEKYIEKDEIVAHPLPAPLDQKSYDRGHLVSLTEAENLHDFQIIEKCDPRENGVGGGVRGGFVNVPMLVGTTPGASFILKFSGTAIGFWGACGPDAGNIEYRIDGGQWHPRVLFTKWSGGLHLPWVHMLATDLADGDHTLELRITEDRLAASKGNAVRIAHFVVNGDRQEPTAIRIMTYNIHHGEGTDGKVDLERIAKVIKDARADVVALQEVDNKTRRTGGIDQTAELAKLTGMHGVFGKQIDYQGGEYGQAILSKFPIKETEVHVLPGWPDREQRIAFLAVIDIGRGLPLSFVTTHLHHKEAELREEQAERVAQLFNCWGPRTVIAGDLNATPDSEALRHFDDMFFNPTKKRPVMTYPSENPAKQIDYVLMRRGGDLEVIGVEPIEAPAASDHRPLLVEFRVK